MLHIEVQDDGAVLDQIVHWLARCNDAIDVLWQLCVALLDQIVHWLARWVGTGAWA
jgi:hypothetical protein